MTKTEKNFKLSNNFLIFAFITSLCVNIVFTLWIQNLNNKYRKTVEKEVFYSTQLEKKMSINGINQETIKHQDKELEMLRKRLKDIKDQDDLLIRDIEVYISTRYVQVPSIVAKNIAENIINSSKKYEISPELIVGMIQVESSFNPSAISSKKARGLMQVMPEWVSKLNNVSSVNDLHDIDVNIDAGVRVLLIHIDEADGSLSKGLYHYVGKSESYVDKVYRAMGQFVAFRSTIDDSSLDGNDEREEKDPSESIQRTEGGN